MEQSLCDRIARRESQKDKTSNSKNKVAFIALQKDIEKALATGWSMKVIWETLTEEGKISFTYKTFRTFVSRLIRLPEERNDCVTLEIKNAKDGTKKKSNATGIPGFTFHPTPNPEELL